MICEKLLSERVWELGFHMACKKELCLIMEPVCMQCGRPVGLPETEYCYDCAKKHRQAELQKFIKQGKALFLYEGVPKEIIYRLKYANCREYAKSLAKLAYEQYGDWIKRNQIEAVIAVPMYHKKQRKRGYNQAELLAKALAKEMGVSCLEGILKKVKDTKEQKKLDDRDRKNNLKNAFQMSKNVVKYKKILLVDDIYTTGNTLETVAQELYRSGISEIYTLVICIGEGQ